MNNPLVVPKTILLSNYTLFICLFLLLAQPLLHGQQSPVDWQEQIQAIKKASGHSPWQWSVKIGQSWLAPGSSQNRYISSNNSQKLNNRLATGAITAVYELSGNRLYLKADFGRLLHTSIWVDDQRFTGKMEPAGFDTLTVYSLAVISQATSLICRWSVAGKTFFGRLSSPAALAAWMNNCEPRGKWTLNGPDQQIEGHLSKAACGNLSVFNSTVKDWQAIIPLTQYHPAGTILHLTEGSQFIKFEEPGADMIESLVLEEPVVSVSSSKQAKAGPNSPIAAFVRLPHTSFLYVQNLEQMPDHQLSVFNRWGKEIFQTVKYKNNWNGNSQGQLVPEGTYYYVIDNGQGETYTGCFNIRS